MNKTCAKPLDLSVYDVGKRVHDTNGNNGTIVAMGEDNSEYAPKRDIKYDSWPVIARNVVVAYNGEYRMGIGEYVAPPKPVIIPIPRTIKPRYYKPTPEQKRQKKRESLEQKHLLLKERVLESKTFPQVSDLLIQHTITISPYSYNRYTKGAAERQAGYYGTSLSFLERYGMARCDSSEIREGKEGKANGSKGTITFNMEVLTESEKETLDDFKYEFHTKIAQKPGSSWGSTKTTINWGWFWFLHVQRLIRLGHIKPDAFTQPAAV